MINRDNWKDTKEYLEYVERIGRDPETVKRIRGLLRHLLEWADETPFPKARGVDPTFPMYLTTRRNDGREGGLGPASMKKACEYGRAFLHWIRGEHLARYKGITASWIETIRPNMSNSMQSEYSEHLFWEIEQVRAVARLAPRNLTEERDQAAVVFMFLSAMRAQAFVSLPVEAVDLENFKVSQFPKLGVHTKNTKAAKTGMLRLKDLTAVVKAWDVKLRAAGCVLWYPRVDRWHRFVSVDKGYCWVTRRQVLNDGIKVLCERAGIPYLSSHKLRHGHAVFVMRRVRNMKELKALSQNMMHSSVAITDGTYARLVQDDLDDLYGGMEE